MTVSVQTRQRLGRTEPRLWTRPLRKLTAATSYGFAVIDFARDVLGEPLDPWQEWLVIHAGELRKDGRPRFRQVLALVSRQQGKTHALKVLSLFWTFVEKWPLTVSMSTTLSYAMEPWAAAVERAEAVPELAARIPRNGIRLTNGEQQLRTVDGCRYKVAASNRRGGRSLTIDRLVIDELREHHDWSAWNAAVPATNARAFAQIFAITNAGDDTAVVLNQLRDDALAGADESLGIFEWSAPDGCEVDDPEAIAAANPAVGRRTPWEVLLGPARRAKAAGGAVEAGFRTEYLCQRVRLLNPAIDPQGWLGCLEVGDLGEVRDRVALCFDVATSTVHATLYAAALMPDGRVRVDPVQAWDGPGCADQAARELPELVARIKPRSFGWLPGGPAEAVGASLKDRAGRGDWPPRGVTVQEVRGELPAVCMGLAELVTARKLVHSGDPLLDAHVGSAERLKRGDGWVFSRRGAGPCDAAYAAAGAAHLARILPKSLGRPRIVLAKPNNVST